MKGLGTDEKAIIKVLTECNCTQRQEIKKQFKLMYGKVGAPDVLLLFVC